MNILDKRIKNLVGKTFGAWIVLEYAGFDNSNKSNVHKWLCQCKCGIEREVNGVNLKKGLSTSCGCSSIKDITGNKYGKLKVIKFMETKNGNAYWECICSCKNKKIVSGHDLRLNRVKSCGCLAGQHVITHGLSNNSSAYYKHLMSDPFRKLKAKISICINKRLKYRDG